MNQLLFMNNIVNGRGEVQRLEKEVCEKELNMIRQVVRWA